MTRLLLLLLPLLLLACQPPRTARDALVRAESVYELACVALEVADAATTAWLYSLAEPTDADLAVAERLVPALVSAAELLEDARAALLRGERALTQTEAALGLLRTASGLLGERAPPGLATALDAADGLLGGGR